METQNKNITEDYVPLEIAKLLKEKGFNVPVRTFYNPKYRGEKVSDGTALINYNADPEDGRKIWRDGAIAKKYSTAPSSKITDQENTRFAVDISPFLKKGKCRKCN